MIFICFEFCAGCASGLLLRGGLEEKRRRFALARAAALGFALIPHREKGPTTFTCGLQGVAAVGSDCVFSSRAVRVLPGGAAVRPETGIVCRDN